MIKYILLIVFVSMCLAYGANACKFDSDCSIGSQCRKLNWSDGVCEGGMNPGNDNDRRASRWHDSRRPGNQNIGETCTNNLQCGLGGRCLKEGYSLRGVCQ